MPLSFGCCVVQMGRRDAQCNASSRRKMPGTFLRIVGLILHIGKMTYLLRLEFARRRAEAAEALLPRRLRPTRMRVPKRRRPTPKWWRLAKRRVATSKLLAEADPR